MFLRPFRVSGIPIDFEIDRFALVIPRARFHENERPGPSFMNPHFLFQLYEPYKPPMKFALYESISDRRTHELGEALFL